MMTSIRSPTMIARWLPALYGWPYSTLSAIPAAMNAAAVSVTNVRSRTVVASPTMIAGQEGSSACLIMVAMIALSLCLGPNVLNGLRITTGTPNDLANASAIISAAILEAEYGDCPCSGWDSSIGIVSAVP